MLAGVSLRLFVALEPPDAVRRKVAALVSDLRRSGAGGVRWVEPGNVHLTLHFLGNAPEARLEDVRRAVSAAAAASRPLHLEVRGAGGFPSARRPRVIWAGLHGDLEALAALARDLGERLAPLGFPPEDRPFSPHLTVGRSRGGAPGLAGALAAAAQAEGGAFRAAEIVLFRSHLSPSGPSYEALLRAPLGSGG